MDKIKLVVISDADDAQGYAIESEIKSFFKNAEIELFNIAGEKFEYCTGCFRCRYRTPGQCVYDDVVKDIIKGMVESDAILFLTRMQFGCHSAQIKKMMDRSIPFETPFLRITDGETHLTPRYPKHRKLYNVAYGEKFDKDEMEIFEELTQRNSRNFDAEWVKPVFMENGESAGQKFADEYGDMKNE